MDAQFFTVYSPSIPYFISLLYFLIGVYRTKNLLIYRVYKPYDRLR